jgi:hypothetical protein
MKLLNVQLGSSPPDAACGEKVKKATYKELFVPPEVSIVSKLMSKTALDPSLQGLDYDSDQEGEPGEAGGEAYDDYDDEDDDPFSNVPPRAENCEHSSPDSYAWAILRLAVSEAQIRFPIFKNRIFRCCTWLRRTLRVSWRWRASSWPSFPSPPASSTAASGPPSCGPAYWSSGSPGAVFATWYLGI